MVTDSRPVARENAIRRRRRCKKCRVTFTTYECLWERSQRDNGSLPLDGSEKIRRAAAILQKALDALREDETRAPQDEGHAPLS